MSSSSVSDASYSESSMRNVPRHARAPPHQSESFVALQPEGEQSSSHGDFRCGTRSSGKDSQVKREYLVPRACFLGLDNLPRAQGREKVTSPRSFVQQVTHVCPWMLVMDSRMLIHKEHANPLAFRWSRQLSTRHISSAVVRLSSSDFFGTTHPPPRNEPFLPLP